MSELLTRNRYRIGRVIRAEPAGGFPGVACRLYINDQFGVVLLLTPEEFTALTEDLGLRPTSPEATEYESVSIYRARREDSEAVCYPSPCCGKESDYENAYARRCPCGHVWRT